MLPYPNDFHANEQRRPIEPRRKPCADRTRSLITGIRFPGAALQLQIFRYAIAAAADGAVIASPALPPSAFVVFATGLGVGVLAFGSIAGGSLPSKQIFDPHIPDQANGKQSHAIPLLGVGGLPLALLAT